MNIYHHYTEKIQNIFPSLPIPFHPADWRPLTPYGDLSFPIVKYIKNIPSTTNLLSSFQDPFILTASIHQGFLNLNFTPSLWQYKLKLFLESNQILIEKRKEGRKILKEKEDFTEQILGWEILIFIGQVQKYFDKIFNSNFFLYKNNVFQYLTTKDELAMIATLALWIWDRPLGPPQDKLLKISEAYNRLRHRATKPGMMLRFLNPSHRASSHAKVLLLTAIDLTLTQGIISLERTKYDE